MADEPNTIETPTREAANEAAYERLKDQEPKSDSEIIARQADEAAAPEPKKKPVRAKGPDGKFLKKEAAKETPPAKPDAEFGWQDDELDSAAPKNGDDADPDETPKLPKWLDDDLRVEATAVGIDDEDLAAMTSREELDRAMRFRAKLILKAGDGGEAVKAGKADATAAEKKPTKADPPAAPPEDDYTVGLSADDYGKDLIEELGKLHGHVAGKVAKTLQAVEARVAAMEQAAQQREVQAREREFDALIDALDVPDLFGTTNEENKEQQANRQTVYTLCERMLRGMEAAELPPQLTKGLVNTLARGQFSEFYLKQQRKELTKRISRQHEKILGSGSFSTGTPKGSFYEKAERRRAELETRGR